MGSIRLNGATSGYLELKAPDVSPDAVLTLPSTGFGKILQIVRATDTTDRTTTSLTYVDANISVTITPQKSDSAILLVWTFQARFASGYYIITTITDSSNNSLSGDSYMGSQTATAFSAWPGINVGYATPATTSATTYKGRFRSSASGQTSTLYNSTFGIGQLFALEIAA